jgi:hypothetical protein
VGLNLRTVFMGEERLRMAAGEFEQEHFLSDDKGDMHVLWQLNRADMGQALQVTTGGGFSF